MSYILDALKKSEEKRKHEKEKSFLPPSPTPAYQPAEKESRQYQWLSILLILALFCSTIAFYLSKRLSPPELETRQRQTTVTPMPGEQKSAEAEQKRPIIELKATRRKKLIAQAETPVSPAKVEPLKEKEVYQPEIYQPAPIIDEPTPAPAALPEPEPRHRAIPYLEELPDGFREEVPVFNLAGHVYSFDPSLRLILVNNVIVREKDVVERVFVLEEIIPDGIILRKGEVYFRLDAY